MIFFFQSLDFFLPLSNYLLRFCHLLLQLPASIFDRLNLIILSQIDTTFLTPCAHVIIYTDVVHEYADLQPK